MIVNRIQRLVCVACGTDQRVKLRSIDGVDEDAHCVACNESVFASWPRVPAPKVLAAAPYMSLSELIGGVTGAPRDPWHYEWPLEMDWLEHDPEWYVAQKPEPEASLLPLKVTDAEGRMSNVDWVQINRLLDEGEQ